MKKTIPSTQVGVRLKDKFMSETDDRQIKYLYNHYNQVDAICPQLGDKLQPNQSQVVAGGKR